MLWVDKSTQHYLAAPVPSSDVLLVSSLAGLNTSAFRAVSLNSTAPDRTKWAKAASYLKLPTVCAPAVAGNLVVFGDGMHQTSGAVLHGLRLDRGTPLWQYPLPGELVHLEGSPTIVEGRVIIGGGNGGVICVDPARLELDGKESDAAGIQAILDARWKEMLAKYEVEKKTDPDFAIRPTEESLPNPKPRLVWQAGAGKWHVDAPVAVAGDRVLVATAYLDAEKTGERALCCLKLSDGSLIWKAPLKLNSAGGPTVVGDLVLIAGSSIRLEPRDIPGAQGEVTAVSLADGSVKWRKGVPAGIVSSIAVQNGLAITTATDGCVRAWDIATGQERWKSDPAAPFFASPAVTGNVVYVADLKGLVQALSLTDGKPIWKLNLATDPQVQAPGMVYGGPVITGGRLYVATCNVDSATKSVTAIVCVGD